MSSQGESTVAPLKIQFPHLPWASQLPRVHYVLLSTSALRSLRSSLAGGRGDRGSGFVVWVLNKFTKYRMYVPSKFQLFEVLNLSEREPLGLAYKICLLTARLTFVFITITLRWLLKNADSWTFGNCPINTHFNKYLQVTVIFLSWKLLRKWSWW